VIADENSHDSINHTIKISFRVTPEEYECIDVKRQVAQYKTISAYVRRAAVFGKFYMVDKSQFSSMYKMLSGIRGSLNQIAKRINSTDRIYDEDFQKISETKEVLEGICRSLQSIQSSLH
jgi:hypothetical protein